MAGGRPTKMTADVLRLLKDAFLSDATHEEACIYANVCTTAFYEYKKKHPEFAEEIDKIKGMTGLQAKINVRKAVEGEASDEKGVSKSQWYLERRDPEFKQKSEVKNEVVLDSATALIDAIKGRKKERGIG